MNERIELSLQRGGWLLVLLISLLVTKAQAENVVLSVGWQFRQAGLGEWLPASVPGTVHTDLYANKKIGDPFYRTNEKDQQWIDKVNWEYRTTFNVTARQLSNQRKEMVFYGLDTYADVYLNGKQILTADNMFRTWRAEVSQTLREGENELRIYFHSPIIKGLELQEQHGMMLPAGNDQSENGGLGPNGVSVFTRKAGYHYGWDWGPRFVTTGIWRPINIEFWDKVKIDHLFIRQPEVTAKKATLCAEIDLRTTTSGEATVKVTNQTDHQIVASQTINMTEGPQTLHLPFEIKNPRLWWTNGLGKPNQYDFSVTIEQDGQELGEAQVTTGLRSLHLIRQKDKVGESFYFELNGIPVFAKGADYIPSDNFLPRVTKEIYKKTINDVVSANMNMLRVWGGGVFEDDEFYKQCDEKGILIWQDFLFACSMYPGEESFIENVKQEAIDNVVRLRNHPCIALWCGNNEIDTMWQWWKDQYSQSQRTQMGNDYVKIFHSLIPDVVKEYTDGDDYWPSSPMGGSEINDHVNGKTSGDAHYWGVWHGQQKFEEFENHIGRFMTEYGFQSFPEFESVKKYTIPEDYNIESSVMVAHQRSGIGNLRIKEYMGWYYHVPEDFEQFLYISQVLQARGIKEAIEAHRRAKPYCMGTLYWQLNDCWPVASWSGIDYYHNWKALHYAAREAYKPVIVSSYEKDGKLGIYVVSDELKPVKGILEVKVIDFSGKEINKFSMPFVAERDASLKVTELKVKDLLKDADVKDVVALLTIRSGKKIFSTNEAYFVKPKDLNLVIPNLKIEVKEQKEKKWIEVCSDKLAGNVMFYIPGHNVFFSDNYMDILPGKVYRIELTTDLSRNEIAGQIRYRHLLSK